MTIFCPQQSKRRTRIAAVACGLFAVLLWSAGANAERYRPANPDAVLLRLPGESGALSAAVRTPTADLERARHEMRNGRLTLDERYFGRARALLENALPCVTRKASQLEFERCDHDPTTVALLITYADVLQHGHEFGNAERALDRVLGFDGAREAASAHPCAGASCAAQARVMRASIRVALGRPLEASKDCRALIGIDTLVATACIAQAISLNGRLAEAHGLLSTELARTNAQGERTAWAFAILAELSERLGRYDDAIAAMDRALSANPSDAALRIQAADLMLRTDRPERVSQILGQLPRVESVVLRRALSAKRTGAADADALAREWRARVERNTKLSRPAHLRDAAIAALHLEGQAREALRHAVANWNESKEIEDARILIAAAIAARQVQAAAPALRWIDELNIEDATIRLARARASI